MTGGYPCSCCSGCTSCSNSASAAKVAKIVISGVVNGSACPDCATIWNNTFVTSGTVTATGNHCQWIYMNSTTWCSRLFFQGYWAGFDVSYDSTANQTTLTVFLEGVAFFGAFLMTFQNVVTGRIDCNSFTNVSLPYASSPTGGFSSGTGDCDGTGASCTVSLM